MACETDGQGKAQSNDGDVHTPELQMNWDTIVLLERLLEFPDSFDGHVIPENMITHENLMKVAPQVTPGGDNAVAVVAMGWLRTG